jgi:imidazolonepropionase-like amidohydrolase
MTALLALLGLLGCGEKPVSRMDAETDGFVVVDVTVFDPDVPALVPHRDVLVRGPRIEAVRTHGGALPAELPTVQGVGLTLIPGLVDAHTHTGATGDPPGSLSLPDTQYNLSAWLAAGVTTVFDMGGRTSHTRKLAGRSEAGSISAPRVYTATPPITVPGAHPLVLGDALLPWPIDLLVGRMIPVVEHADEAAEVVARELESGPDWVKVVCDELPPGTNEMGEDVLVALVNAAHAEGKKVAVHVGDEDNALAAVRAGADLLAHGIWRGEVSADGAAEIARSGTPMVATLAGFELTKDIAAGRWAPTQLDRRLVDPDRYGPLIGEKGKALGQVPALGAFAAAIHEDMAANILQLHQAGVVILVGSDAPLPGIYAGSGLHRELAALTRAGIPSLEVLAGATSRPADWVGTRNWGRVIPGGVADLVLVRGDVSTDLTSLAEPVHIWRAGRVVHRAGRAVSGG